MRIFFTALALLLTLPSASAYAQLLEDSSVIIEDDDFDYADDYVGYFEDENMARITGRVESFFGEEFTLDYGDGEITVDLDNLDIEEEQADLIRESERVTVYGDIDEDLIDDAVIDASSIIIRDDNISATVFD